MLDLTNRSVLGFQVEEIIKAQVCYAGVAGKYPKEAKRSIRRILFTPGMEEAEIEAVFADKQSDTWLLLDPKTFKYADVDMILVTDTTFVGINVTIADDHSPVDRFFKIWTPIAQKQNMGNTGLIIAPGSFSHIEANVDKVDLALVHHEL